MVLVQTGSGTVSGNMELPRPETKRSHVFGKIPDRDWDHWVWSSPDWVPIGLGRNFPNTTTYLKALGMSLSFFYLYKSKDDRYLY